MFTAVLLLGNCLMHKAINTQFHKGTRMQIYIHGSVTVNNINLLTTGEEEAVSPT
jgi:hypothetical protein